MGLTTVCCRWIWEIFMASYSTARAAKPKHVATRLHTVITLYPGNRKLPRSTPNQYHVCICNDVETSVFIKYARHNIKETPGIKIILTLITSISSRTPSTRERHSWRLISHACINAYTFYQPPSLTQSFLSLFTNCVWSGVTSQACKSQRANPYHDHWFNAEI